MKEKTIEALHKEYSNLIMLISKIGKRFIGESRNKYQGILPEKLLGSVYHLCKTFPEHLPEVSGPDFENFESLIKVLDQYQYSGIQATMFYRATQVFREMLHEKQNDNFRLLLSFNSAQATSGVREVLRFMIEQNMIDIAIASPKGIDADIAKAVGKFGSDSIKNVFDFALEQLRKLTQNQETFTTRDLLIQMGQQLQDSILSSAANQQVDIYSPGISNSVVGDAILMHCLENPQFTHDLMQDQGYLLNSLANKTCGSLILGGSVTKYAHLAALKLSENLKYSVEINTAQNFDDSFSGSIQYQKKQIVDMEIELDKSKHIHVYSDTSLILPLLVYKAMQG